MEFWQKVKQEVTEASDTVSKKAKDTSESLRLSNAIRSTKTALERQYAALGRALFQLDPVFCETRCPELVQTLDELTAELEEQLERKGAPKSGRVCVACGKPLAGDARFCVYCGAAAEGRRKEESQIVICQGCGKRVDASTAVCIYCGTRLG